METKPILTKIAVRHFLSLRQVELPITPLTALVGPNASGKSNLLKALLLMNQMLVTNALPSAGWIQNRLWADGGQDLELEFETIISGRGVRYALVLRPDPESRIQRETLEIDGKPIIKALDSEKSDKAIKSGRYREALAPKVAEYIEISHETLKRNRSFEKFANLLKNQKGHL